MASLTIHLQLGSISQLLNTTLLHTFPQVSEEHSTEDNDNDSNIWNTYQEDEEDAEEGAVYFVLQENTGYMAPTLRILAIIHTIISFVCVIGYYCLKVQSIMSG